MDTMNKGDDDNNNNNYYYLLLLLLSAIEMSVGAVVLTLVTSYQFLPNF